VAAPALKQEIKYCRAPDGTRLAWAKAVAMKAETTRRPASAGGGQDVAHEVEAAALPRRGEDLGHRCLDALMPIGDDQLDAAQAAAGELAQEAGPEGLGLGGTDIETHNLAPAIGIDADRHDHGDRQDAIFLAEPSRTWR
jgi:hypothetical protein